MRSKSERERFPGVYWSEDDRDKGPFVIRLGGTSEFVSNINPHDEMSWPPGRVDFVKGWENSASLTYEEMDDAIKAASQVWDIEGFHTSVEALGRFG